MMNRLITRDEKQVAQLGQALAVLYQNQTFVDVRIQCRDGEVLSNSSLLALVSPFLKQIFDSRKIPAEEEQYFLIVLPNFFKNDLDQFLKTVFHFEDVKYATGAVEDLAEVLQVFEDKKHIVDLDDGDQSEIRNEILEDNLDKMKNETKAEFVEEEDIDDPDNREDYNDEVLEKIYYDRKKGGRPRKGEEFSKEEEHFDTINNEQGRIHQCKTCTYKTKDKFLMKQHVRVHTGEKPYICKFPGCGLSFPRPQNLWRHNKHHMSIKPHICSVCDKGFIERRDLLEHIVIHDESRKSRSKFVPEDLIHLLDTNATFEFEGREVTSDAVCNVCYKIFEKPHLMKRHLRQVHEDNFKTWKCEEEGCDKVFKSKAGLERHHVDHSGELPFQCPDCPKMFKTSTELNGHLVRHMDPEDIGKNRKCEDCGQIFEKKSRLDIHIRRHHTKEKPFKCNDCEKSFTLKEGLTDHKRTHSGEKPFECDVCQKGFTTKSALNVHKMIHDEMKRYSCDYQGCDKIFRIHKNLWKHKKLDHSLESKTSGLLSCDQCGKRCSDKNQLEKHMIKHTTEKNFVCNICGKRLKRQTSLDLHLIQHTGVKKFMCDECDTSYFTASALRNHKVNKHTELKASFLCTFCGKAYTKKANLDAHISLHTGEKRYQCPHCEKRFRSHSVYQNHVRVHTGQKQYVCTYCGKAFMQRSHLKRHTATHTGERNHVCPVCSKTFIEPGDVRKHMRTHNKETSAGAVSGVRIAKENSQETHPPAHGARDVKPPAPNITWTGVDSSVVTNMIAMQRSFNM